MLTTKNILKQGLLCFSLLLLAALNFSCRTTKTSSYTAPKPVFKVYQVPSGLPPACENLPSFTYNSDSTNIYYHSVITINNTEGILEKINHNLSKQAFASNFSTIEKTATLLSGYYSFNFPDKDGKIQVYGSHTRPPGVSCAFTIELNKNEFRIIAEEIRYFNGSRANVTYIDSSTGKLVAPPNQIEYIRANLYYPGKEKPKIEGECYLLIQMDQTIKNLISELASQIIKASKE